MNEVLRTLVQSSLLTALGLCSMGTAPVATLGMTAPEAGVREVVATSWICDRADNICGLDDAKTLSNPAKVEYDTLLKATTEWKKLKDEKIDANSAEGIQLRQKASERVRDGCEKVRTAKGYCSVWKTIRHSDGRAIPDITDAVKEQL